MRRVIEFLFNPLAKAAVSVFSVLEEPLLLVGLLLAFVFLFGMTCGLLDAVLDWLPA